jgi:hypothetical protein
MNTELLHLRNQIKHAAEALGKVSVQDKKTMISSHFAADFNRLIGLCKALLPDVNAGRWPSELDVRAVAMGPSLSNATIAEARVYYAQLISICDQNLKDFSMAPRRTGF